MVCLKMLEINSNLRILSQNGDGALELDEVKKLIEENNFDCVPGMAFVPDAPNLSKVLSSFGPQQSKADFKVKKNLQDVQTSICSMLRQKYENELNSVDVGNMRWASFASFNRKVGDESVMTGKTNIVQVKNATLRFANSNSEKLFFEARFKLSLNEKRYFVSVRHD
jgi:hypothetical protein